MALPDYQTLMLPVLKVAAEGETRVPVAAEKIANTLGLTAEDRDELLPSGRQRLLHNRIHWAKFYMSKAGLIESPKRGVFKATDAGIELLQKSPPRIDVELLKAYPDFLTFYLSNSPVTQQSEQPIAAAIAESSATPEEQVEAAQTVLHSALRAELLQRILDTFVVDVPPTERNYAPDEWKDFHPLFVGAVLGEIVYC